MMKEIVTLNWNMKKSRGAYGIIHDDTNANDEDFDCPIAVADIGRPIGRFLYDTREEAIEAWNRRMNDD